MTIRHIRIFLELLESGCNTTRAAEALHMTQPAVSLAIRELETYYGVRLFERLGRRLVVTEAGERFRSYAMHIAELFDGMEKTLRDWERLGVLRVGASLTVGAQFLPSYVETFSKLHPGADVRVTVAPSKVLEGMLLNNELDFALIEGVVHEPVLVSEEYMEDHLTVVCPADGPFRQGQQLTQEEFRSQRFLLRERGSGTREEFDHATESAGFLVQPIWESTFTTALVNAVIHGLGIAVLPHRMILGPLERGLVVTVSVEGLQFGRSFRIIYHKDKYLPPLAQAFLELCRSYEMDYPMPKYNGLY